jgi:hypothetical protein
VPHLPLALCQYPSLPLVLGQWPGPSLGQWLDLWLWLVLGMMPLPPVRQSC